MINRKKFLQDEQEFWQNQFINPGESPIPQELIRAVDGGIVISPSLSLMNTAQLITPSPVGEGNAIGGG